MMNELLGRLPTPYFPIIGRHDELAALTTLLRSTNVRLVTVTGTGGVGKTCLAVQAAQDLRNDFVDGLVFVSLASLGDPSLVIPVIAQTLGLLDGGDEILHNLLKKYLSERQFLLVIDNFEQVIEAAPQLSELSAACPGLKLLVTSREALHLYGERELPLEPLPVPDLHHITDKALVLDNPAIQLFITRLNAVQPEYMLSSEEIPVIAEICARLDGLPLALELAVARIKLLPPVALLSYLVDDHLLRLLKSNVRDIPARHQTLHNAIEWSYRLLSAPEQSLFRQLTVFSGSFTLVAVQAISKAAGAVEDDLLDHLASLLDKHLIRRVDQGSPRLMMLATIRQYGLQQLRDSSQNDLTYTAFLAYYLTVAETAETKLAGAEQRQWLEKLETEHDNLRSALQYSIAHAQAEIALRLGAAMWRFWFMRGYQTEGRYWLTQILRLNQGANTPIHSKALEGAAMLALYQSDYPVAIGFYEQCIAFYRSVTDPYNLSLALNGLAHARSYRGDYEQANALSSESVTISRTLAEAGNWGALAFALFFQGFVAWQAGNYPLANHAATEAHSIFERLGDQWGRAFALQGLAHTAVSEGHAVRAHPLFEEALAIMKTLGDRRSMAMCSIGLGYIQAKGQHTTAARTLFCDALNTLSEFGDNWFGTLAWEGLAEVAFVEGNVVRSVQLLGLAAHLREAIGAPVPVSRHNAYQLLLNAVRDSLGQAAFERAWSEGQQIRPEVLLTFEESLETPDVTAAKSAALSEKNDGLSNRELEVLRLVAQGLTDAQIATRLVISTRTVGSHLRSIYGKLAVSSRSAATRYAFEHYLV